MFHHTYVYTYISLSIRLFSEENECYDRSMEVQLSALFMTNRTTDMTDTPANLPSHQPTNQPNQQTDTRVLGKITHSMIYTYIYSTIGGLFSKRVVCLRAAASPAGRGASQIKHQRLESKHFKCIFIGWLGYLPSANNLTQ